jgi:hypothetical protein
MRAKLLIQKWMLIKIERLFHPQFMCDPHHVSPVDLSESTLAQESYIPFFCPLNLRKPKITGLVIFADPAGRRNFNHSPISFTFHVFWKLDGVE